jgi:hypothetical protein
MASDRSLREWLKERRQQALIAVLGIALAVTVYLLVDGHSAVGSLIQGLALSAIFAAVAYLFANYFLFSDELEPAQIYRRIGEIVKDRGLREISPHVPAVKWHRFLNEPPVMAVEGFVRYLDGPLDDDHEAFVTFFQRGGRFTVVLPSEDEALAMGIAQQFDPDNPTQPERILGRIAATRKGLERAVAEADRRNHEARRPALPADLLTILTSARAPNFWVLVGDSQRALFAPYDNWAKSGRRMPILEFDLSVATELAECLDHEMTRFKKQPPRVK